MLPSLTIFTEGSSEIGLGHVRRCITLKNKLIELYQNKININFFITDQTDYAARIFLEEEQCKLNNQIISEEIINSVMVIILFFLGGIFVISLLFFLEGYDFITSVSAAITSIAVVGPGLGSIIGPEESFSSLPSNLKIILAAAMIIGRLEFIAFFVLLLPTFWKQK